MSRTRAWSGRRRALIVAVAAALLLAAGLAMLRADAVDRVVHPQRYRVSGAERLPADTYVTAARGAIGRGERIGKMVFAKGFGPVAVSIVPVRGGTGRTVYLDPPTARVLAVGADEEIAEPGSPPLARPAQSVASVIARAQRAGRGAVLAVTWPTTRNPDWAILFAEGAARRIKVADDSGSARPVVAREQGGITGDGWPIVAAGVLAVVGMTLLMRRRR